MSDGWIPFDADHVPPEGVELDTKIDDSKGVRNEQPMTYRSGLWWINGGEMYVYYRPTHWRRKAKPA